MGSVNASWNSPLSPVTISLSGAPPHYSPKPPKTHLQDLETVAFRSGREKQLLHWLQAGYARDDNDNDNDNDNKKHFTVS